MTQCSILLGTRDTAAIDRTDHDPRVRHRADALLALARGRSVEETAQAMGCCTKRIRVWRRRFLAEGRTGLADHPPRTTTKARRPGPRPPGDGAGGFSDGLRLSGHRLDGG